MRVFASKNLGHGVRVGVSQNVRPGRQAPTPRTRGGDPIVNGKVVKAPPVTRWLLIAIGVTGGIGLVVFPPLLIVTAVCLVLLVVAHARWNKAQQIAAQIATQDRRPPVGTPERQAYDARAARIAELDAQRAVSQAEYERLAAQTARRLGGPGR